MGRLRHEAGQTVVLFAVLLPLFLGLGVIAVDIGYWYVVKKTAQDTADAAALAAAREIPSCVDVGCPAYEQAERYVQANMPDAMWDVQFPYIPSSDDSGVSGGGVPDPTKIEVTVTHATGTFFGRLFGLFAPTVSRRAVAEQRPAVNEVAIHAHDANCANDALSFNGSNMDIDGELQANGSFRLNGDNFLSGPASAGGPNSCPILVVGNNPSFSGNPAPANRPATLGWPAYFIPAEFNCDHRKRNFVFNDNNVEIPPGIYCAEESFDAGGSNQWGHITVLSPNITINGDNQQFAPADDGKGLLFFHIPNSTPPLEDDFEAPHCEHRNQMTLNASTYDFKGIIFNPCDRITINGSGVLDGLVEGFTVDIAGEAFRMKAGGELPNQVRLALAE